MKKLNRKGFTIVEMAIVVVVIGLVVGIGLFAKNRMSNSESDAQAAGFSNPINNTGMGKLYVCKITNNYKDGIKYYFTGNNAKQARAIWTYRKVGSASGGTGQDVWQTKANNVRLYKPTVGSIPGTEQKVFEWKFNLQSKSLPTGTITSLAATHGSISTC